MEDYYTIQTPGHHSAMFAELHVLQKQGVMCDVILAAEDGEVMAHKVVLMAASKYFRDKLSPVIGPTASKICLKGISVVELANLVKYIYTGKLLVAKETMDITLEISEILQLQGVMQGYKEIITYEQMKDTPINTVSCKSEFSAIKSPSPSETCNTEKKTSPQKADAERPKAVTPAEPGKNIVHKVSSNTSGTQSLAAISGTLTFSSDTTQPDLNKCSKVPTHVHDGSEVIQDAHHVDNAGDAANVNNTQSTSSDFNFDTLYNQQYLDVSAGSRTPSKSPGANTEQTASSLPKLQQMAPVPTESQKIAEERAQHQDLLAVAIETLSDVPYLKQQPSNFQPEVDKAVSSITNDDAQPTTQVIHQNPIGMKPDEEDLEDYENGLTSTKTFTMSAGSVNNELGGKTDVYTVALDPATVKTPLKMPRPKRTKTAKEKEAEEKAKKYRHIKAVLMSGTAMDSKPLSITNVEPRRGSRQKTTTVKQDFQYESLSKTKKKIFTPKILLVPKESASDLSLENKTSNNEKEPSSQSFPKVIKVPLGGKDKLPKEEKIEVEGGNFGQVVNFDSESEDDVNSLIVNDMLEAYQSDGSHNKRTNPCESSNIGTYLTNLKEKQKKIHTLTSQSPDRNGKGSKRDNCITNENDEEGNTLNVIVNSAPTGTKSIEKRKGTDTSNDDISEGRGLLDDFHTHDIDEATDERNRSSSTKRKTRTPRKLPLSDEEKGNESVSDRHDNIPVVRVRRSSRSLNLDKEKEDRVNKQESYSENDLKLDGTKKKKLKTCFEGGNIDCKDSRAAEIKIIAQKEVDEKALGEAEKQINESKSKKIIIVPKYFQPEIRLKKRTTEEMLQLAKELPKSTGKAPSDEIEFEIEYETGGGGDDDDDYEEMSADDDMENVNSKNEGKSMGETVVKRKLNDLFTCSPVKKRKIGNQVNQKSELNDAGNGTEEQKVLMKVEIDDEEVEIDNQTNETARRTSVVERIKSKGKGKKTIDPSKEKSRTKIVDGDGANKSDEEDVDIDYSKWKGSVCSTDEKEQEIDKGDSKKNAKVGPESCAHCGKTFKTPKILKRHIEYCHTEKEKIQCEFCDFATPYKSSMQTHQNILHSRSKEMFMCKFCDYGTPLTGNLRKHLSSAHGLIVITRQHKNFSGFEEGTIITKDHKVFDPKTMKVPKTTNRRAYVFVDKDSEETDASGSRVKVKDKKRTKISLSKLPVDDFLKEMMKRHQEYVQTPERNYSFMSSSIAAATEHPSFPQASPQVRNTRANKIYNMKKLKPTFTPQPETGLYGMGNVQGMYQGTATVPQVASEVEVEHDEQQPEVVLENVEDDAPTTVLTISEQKGNDGTEMIMINQNGKQTIVRSKDFYDTLQATGHDASQTFGVISALLQAGEQIEIREQEEVVEIQNI